jgi:hypothetical protein
MKLSAFKRSLFTLVAMVALTAPLLWPASGQPRVMPMVHTQSAAGVEEQVGYRYRHRYDYRPYNERYGYYRPRYRPYYGYPLDMETYAVWRNKRPTWFPDY